MTLPLLMMKMGTRKLGKMFFLIYWRHLGKFAVNGARSVRTSKSSPVIGRWRDIIIAANPKGCLRYASVKSSFYLGVSGWVDLSNVFNQSCYCRGKSRTLKSCEGAEACVKSVRFNWKIGLRSRSRCNNVLMICFYYYFF